MNTPTVETGNEALDSGESLALLRRRKWPVLGVVALCSTAFCATALLMIPAYRVTMALAPARTEGGLGGLGGGLGRFGSLAAPAGVSIGGGDGATEAALAVLGSQEFTQRFIVESNLLSKLNPSKWDAAAVKWAVAPGKEPTPARAAQRFSRQIRTIARDRKTGLVTMSIDWRDWQETREWNHKLVETLNEEMRRRAMRDADNYITHLGSEFGTTMVDTRIAISRLLEAQMKQRMTATVTHAYLKERERQQLQGLTGRLKQDLGTLTLQSLPVGGQNTAQAADTLAIGQSLLKELQSAEPVGRFVVDLGGVLAGQPGSPSDLVMRNGDRLRIPKKPQDVTAIGAVRNSTSHLYVPGLAKDEYRRMNGGTTKKGDGKRIYVVRANGSVNAGGGSRWFRSNSEMRPDYKIAVPLAAERVRPLPVWTAVSTILYNVAISVATVKSF